MLTKEDVNRFSDYYRENGTCEGIEGVDKAFSFIRYITRQSYKRFRTYSYLTLDECYSVGFIGFTKGLKAWKKDGSLYVLGMWIFDEVKNALIRSSFVTSHSPQTIRKIWDAKKKGETPNSKDTAYVNSSSVAVHPDFPPPDTLGYIPFTQVYENAKHCAKPLHVLAYCGLLDVRKPLPELHDIHTLYNEVF